MRLASAGTANIVNSIRVVAAKVNMAGPSEARRFMIAADELHLRTPNRTSTGR